MSSVWMDYLWWVLTAGMIAGGFILLAVMIDTKMENLNGPGDDTSRDR